MVVVVLGVIMAMGMGMGYGIGGGGGCAVGCGGKCCSLFGLLLFFVSLINFLFLF